MTSRILVISLVHFLCSLLIVACSENKTEKKSESETAFAEGKTIYMNTCSACHQANGEGMGETFPPLANSDYLLSDVNRAIKQIIKGSNDTITVNGKTYKGLMPPQLLTDEEIVAVMNYVLNSWGNKAGTITIEDVKAVRSK